MRHKGIEKLYAFAGMFSSSRYYKGSRTNILYCSSMAPAPAPAPDAPALLDSMRRGLVPLVRQGRRGPALDLDAFLLVALEEYSDGGRGLWLLGFGKSGVCWLEGCWCQEGGEGRGHLPCRPPPLDFTSQRSQARPMA